MKGPSLQTKESLSGDEKNSGGSRTRKGMTFSSGIKANEREHWSEKSAWMARLLGWARTV